MCDAWLDLAGNLLALPGCFEGSIVRFICRYDIPWEGRDDHTKRPSTGGLGNRGRRADVWSPRVCAPLRGGRVDPVRRACPDPATGLALRRPALARGGRRASLHAFGRGDRDRGRWPSYPPPRRRGMLAGGYGERSPGREPFEGALLLPHLRLGGGARRRPLPERGRSCVPSRTGRGASSAQMGP